jgi:hypothetical protein
MQIQLMGGVWMDQGFEALVAQISSVVKLSENDAHCFATDMYGHGIVSLNDADGLFTINFHLAGSCPAWDRLFIAAIKDHLLVQNDPRNWVSEEEAEWLIGKTTRGTTGPIASEVDLLLQVIRYAEGVPERLGSFALQMACERITFLGKAVAEDVERVRRALIIPAGEHLNWITAPEADLLVKTNDLVAHSLNDPSWNDLFARAIANRLMARAHPDPASQPELMSREHWIGDMRPEPGTFLEDVRSAFTEDGWFHPISRDEARAQAARQVARASARREADIGLEDEAAWFLARLSADKPVSLAERALIDFLKVEAPGFAQGLAIAA